MREKDMSIVDNVGQSHGSAVKNKIISPDDYFDYLQYLNKKDNPVAYSNYVNSLAKQGSQAIISNGNREHAQVIFYNLLSYSKKEFRILSGSLKKDIYSQNTVISALKDFFSKEDTQIKIILQDQNIGSLEELRRQNKFIDVCLTLSEKEKSRCIIKKTAGKDSEIDEHFAIMDETGYRYCPQRDVTKAIATFNGAEVAKHLKEQFDILLERAETIPPNLDSLS